MGIALIEALVLLVMTQIAMDSLKSKTEELFINRAESVSFMLATSLESPLLSLDIATMHEFIEASLKTHGVVYARILDRDDRVLAESGNRSALSKPFEKDGKIDDMDDGIFDTEYLISVGDTVYGRVELGYSAKVLRESYDTLMKRFLLIGIVGILASALFAVFLGSWLARRLELLKVASERIEMSEEGVLVAEEGNDEISKVSHAFNRMSIVRTRIMEELQRKNSALLKAGEELRDIRDQLEVKVRQRTEEIQSVNEVLSREIDERKQIEESLRRAKNDAEEASRSKSQFLATVSHEIRTPLNAIVGIAEMLPDMKEESEEREDMLTLMNSAVDRLTATINSVLDFSRIESGRIKLKNQPFNLLSKVAECVGMVQGKAEEKGLEMKREIPESLNVMVMGDSLRFGQTIINLLTNAVKYTDEGSVMLKASCRIRDGILSFQASVCDTGSGIPREFHKTLFEPFTRGDDKHNENSYIQGIGLGLAIAKQYALMMGGDIQFECPASGGSVFTLSASFPLAEEGVKGEDDEDEISTSEKDKIAGMKILLAEDDAVNRKLMRRMIQSLGCELLLACNGREAVEIALAEKPDAILMDVSMPVMNGLEATRKIRERDSETPIFAFTAHAFFEERNRCLEAGCTGFVFKPVRLKDLKVALAKMAG